MCIRMAVVLMCFLAATRYICVLHVAVGLMCFFSAMCLIYVCTHGNGFDMFHCGSVPDVCMLHMAMGLMCFHCGNVSGMC